MIDKKFSNNVLKNKENRIITCLDLRSNFIDESKI